MRTLTIVAVAYLAFIGNANAQEIEPMSLEMVAYPATKDRAIEDNAEALSAVAKTVLNCGHLVGEEAEADALVSELYAPTSESFRFPTICKMVKAYYAGSLEMVVSKHFAVSLALKKASQKSKNALATRQARIEERNRLSMRDHIRSELEDNARKHGFKGPVTETFVQDILDMDPQDGEIITITTDDDFVENGE
ncbi:hypothetical protein GF382_03680 [Candidatus Falkowbacteria bacterium]|nr:hypothetical protein [Candidatus Falkowbacteria bacterium]